MGRSIRTERYRYTQWIRTSNGQTAARELYDHVDDPAENVNIASTSVGAAAVRQLQVKLHAGWQAALPPD